MHFCALLLILCVQSVWAEQSVQQQAMSQHIDGLLAKRYVEHQLTSQPVVDDATFIRRSYLSIAGRIPTVEEWTVAMTMSRSELIAVLLASPAQVSAEWNFWADILRVGTRLQGKFPGQPWIDWLKRVLSENMPYDQFVYTMLTSRGDVLAAGNGATGYYLRDMGMPESMISNTVQAFLGTRMKCAQCHDHPDEVWTRKQYYEMMSYTVQTRARLDKKKMKAVRACFAEREDIQELRTAARKIGQALFVTVQPGKNKGIKLPKNYQYTDAQPGEYIQAQTLFGESPTLSKGQDPRVPFATWLTSPSNPYFTTVITNRLWKRLFGVGLIEPVDNITEETVSAYPELHLYLDQIMRELSYDMRAFKEVLYNTRLWQSAAIGLQGYNYTGPLLRRMTAEQVWDSMMTLIVPDLDERMGENSADTRALYEQSKAYTGEQLVGLAESFVRQHKELTLMRKKAKTIRKEMTLLPKPEQKEQRKILQGLWKQMDEGFSVVKQIHGGRKVETDPRWKRFSKDFKRASELPTPAQPGSFLREFGQSDRAEIENGKQEAVVTQALSLMNGMLDKQLRHSRSVLATLLEQAPESEKVRVLFTAILSREVHAEEQEMIATAYPQYTAQVYRDIAWVLLNSREFLFIR